MNVAGAQTHAVPAKTRDTTPGILLLLFLETSGVLMAVAQNNRSVQTNEYMMVGAYRKNEPLSISERTVTLVSSLASQPRDDRRCKQSKNM